LATKADVAELRAVTKADFANLRAEFVLLRTEFATFRMGMEKAILASQNRMLLAIGVMLTAAVGVLLAFLRH